MIKLPALFPSKAAPSFSGDDSHSLEDIFYSHQGNMIIKWKHYFEIYERHFSRFKNTNCVILEIGVCHGGSLQMWRKFLGPKARIIGVDVEPRCKELEEPGLEIMIGSQSDREFLRKLKRTLPKVDILIDDGGHMMDQQIITFEEMYEHVRDGGVYLCEDLHTSYWNDYGGGYRNPTSFIEYSKNFVDWLNAYHSRDKTEFQPNHFTQSANSIHYYDSVMVVEKKKRREPEMINRGVATDIFE